jgi:hypothetical protein
MANGIAALRLAVFEGANAMRGVLEELFIT